MFLRALLGLALAACLLNGQTPSVEARLEAAIHSEVVNGDVKGALDQYQKLLADAGSNRQVAARALLGMADCKQKLGETAEAQTLYLKVTVLYSDQTATAAEAKARGTALANAAAGPLNLNFQNGIGATGTGWFVPKALNEAGYSAEVQHQGCRQSPTCAVVIGSASPKAQMFGNLMQYFNATAYRGKTVRLRAFLKMDSTNPDDGRRCGYG